MITSRSALAIVATLAARESFSPTSSSNSSIATVSFSLTIGITPCDKRRSIEFTTCCLRSSRSTYLVRSTCATTILYSAKNLSYIYISSHCPTAAHACLPGVSCGRLVMPSFPMPSAIAPLDTSTISWPAFWRSARVLTRFSTRRIFNRPVRCVNVEVPTFTTTLFLSLIFLTSVLLFYRFCDSPTDITVHLPKHSSHIFR